MRVCQHTILYDKLLREESGGYTMSKRINIEDNIFSINSRIRILQDSLILEIDPNLFLENIVIDIDFIHTAMEYLLQALIENGKFIERNEQLENLFEAEQEFSTLLLDILQKKGLLAEALQPIKEKFVTLREKSFTRAKHIQELLETQCEEGNSLVVSSEEMHELLKDIE
jgi:hypothetical protein